MFPLFAADMLGRNGELFKRQKLRHYEERGKRLKVLTSLLLSRSARLISAQEWSLSSPLRRRLVKSRVREDVSPFVL